MQPAFCQENRVAPFAISDAKGVSLFWQMTHIIAQGGAQVRSRTRNPGVKTSFPHIARSSSNRNRIMPFCRIKASTQTVQQAMNQGSTAQAGGGLRLLDGVLDVSLRDDLGQAHGTVGVSLSRLR